MGSSLPSDGDPVPVRLGPRVPCARPRLHPSRRPTGTSAAVPTQTPVTGHHGLHAQRDPVSQLAGTRHSDQTRSGLAGRSHVRSGEAGLRLSGVRTGQLYPRDRRLVHVPIHGRRITAGGPQQRARGALSSSWSVAPLEPAGRPHTGAVLPKTRSEFWFRKLSGNVERDRRNVLDLKRLGWRVLIVWECDLDDESALQRRLSRSLLGAATNG